MISLWMIPGPVTWSLKRRAGIAGINIGALLRRRFHSVEPASQAVVAVRALSNVFQGDFEETPWRLLLFSGLDLVDKPFRELVEEGDNVAEVEVEVSNDCVNVDSNGRCMNELEGDLFDGLE